jgi:cell wall-associated NlpC family hydrolase
VKAAVVGAVLSIPAAAILLISVLGPQSPAAEVANAEACMSGSGQTCASVSPPPSSARAAVVLARAHSMLGKPYCWAAGDASGPTHGSGGAGCDGSAIGFDCSGLALYAWAPYATLAHYTGDQISEGRRVPLQQAQPGDLVFLSNVNDGVHHVAILWSTSGDANGTGQIIEAQDFGVPVHIRSWLGLHEPEALNYAVRPAG